MIIENWLFSTSSALEVVHSHICKRIMTEPLGELIEITKFMTVDIRYFGLKTNKIITTWLNITFPSLGISTV
jgi:hypothetical protein